ncbi:beta-lactamase/transpeptidase-like protein [Ramicandelaber brevisporus]|nr:beta-lactamase/transpeptidase-like protein [Ramicandelaber brevisporus]
MKLSAVSTLLLGAANCINFALVSSHYPPPVGKLDIVQLPAQKAQTISNRRLSASSVDHERSIIESFERDFADVLRTNGVPGMTYAVVRANQTIAASGIGVADVTKPHSTVDADTLFMVGSVSKSMTAALLATLVDDGTLLFTSRIGDVLPLFRLKDPLASAQCTLEDAMLHRTGLPRHDGLLEVMKGQPPDAFFHKIKHLEPSTEFRSTFEYTNLMWATVGHAAAAAVDSLNMTFEDAIQERIFDAIGMRNAVPRPNLLRPGISKPSAGHYVKLADTRANDTTVAYDGYNDAGFGAPAAMVMASANDMAVYMRTLLNKGLTPNGDRVLSTETVDALFRGRIPTDAMRGAFPTPYFTEEQKYGYGWFNSVYRGKHRIVHHGGAWDGFLTLVALFPDEDLAIAASVNMQHDFTANAAVLDLADRFFGYRDVDWALSFGKLVDDMRDEKRKKPNYDRNKQISRPLEAYVGRYEHKGYAVAEVGLIKQSSDSVPRLSVKLGHVEDVLQHAEYDTFVTIVDSQPINFTFFSPNASKSMQKINIQLEPSIPEVIFTRIN